MQNVRRQCWQQIVADVSAQFEALSAADKVWLEKRLIEIEALQRQLNDIFEAVEGTGHCAHCAGDCCARGHNHMTLVNLLQFIRHLEEPPAPDFDQSCPFLGPQGCLLPAGRRPYNCISFICDIIESVLPDNKLAEFYALEGKLRHHYLDIAGRYQGAAMTGLLLQQQRLQGRSFFTLKPASTDDVEGTFSCR